MNWDVALPVLAVLAACWGTVATIRMAMELGRRGEKVDFLLLRLFLPKYVSRYRELTRQELGRPGGLYTSFVISMNLALLLFAGWILMKLLSV